MNIHNNRKKLLHKKKFFYSYNLLILKFNYIFSFYLNFLKFPNWLNKFFFYIFRLKFIISDLENQLELKENLLQRFILIVKDKDKQINQLVNVGLLCNQNTVSLNIYFKFEYL